MSHTAGSPRTPFLDNFRVAEPLANNTSRRMRNFDWPQSAGLRLWTKAMNNLNQGLPTNSSFGAVGERSARTSRIGGWPKKRLYSRLNCVELS